MRKSIAFFDMDGTLWDAGNYIPDSTREGIRRLREHGHLAFINTGRCKGYIRAEKLLGIGFDGIVAGCGTMVEKDGETLFYHRLDNELAAHSIEVVRSYGFRPVLEGRYNLYMDDAEFGDEWYGQKLHRELGEHLLSIEEHWGRWEISKFSCATDHADRDACYEALSEHYDYMIHNELVTEFVPKGFHKGVGVQKVCEMLGIDIADTYVFGDSANDIPMLEAAGHAVVMGNGSDEAKAKAEYVTADLREDGIYQGLSHFGLI